MEKIKVVDSIMGSGKTSAIINMVNANKNTSYIYVTPFLDEIDRFIEGTNYRFKQPHKSDNGKLSVLHKLLSSGACIATTHALFLMATQETIQLIHEGGYTLILDETLDIFREYNEVVKNIDNKIITKGDVQWLLQEGYITVSSENYSVKWSGATTNDFHFSEVERLSKNGSLRCIDDTLFWEYPTEVFTAFESIYILTYLFESTMLSAYFKIYGFNYEKLSAKRTPQGNYSLCQYIADSGYKKELIPLIKIYEGDLNRIGKVRSAFSVNWLSNRNTEQLQHIKRAMRNYKLRVKAPTDTLMWTTAMKNDFHKKLEKIKGFKYIRILTSDEKNLSEKEEKGLRCFVSCTARATNDYSHRSTLLYMLNRFLPPEPKKYFSRCGCPIDENMFATSELLQWIWRSAIRNGEPINLYIPSKRMRNLLYAWLGVDESMYLPRSKKVLEKA